MTDTSDDPSDAQPGKPQLRVFSGCFVVVLACLGVSALVFLKIVPWWSQYLLAPFLLIAGVIAIHRAMSSKDG
jgi:hypothetical protein